MLYSILRVVRVAAVLTIGVTLFSQEAVRPAVAEQETDAAKCQNAEGTWCAGTLFNPEAECTGSVSPCTTCGEGSGSCATHNGYRTV